MISKEFVYAAIEGRKLEHYPVHSSYTFLSNADHWNALTGKTAADFYRWTLSDTAEHEKVYKVWMEKLPYDTFIPYQLPSYEVRETIEVVEKDNLILMHDKKEDTYKRMSGNIHDSGSNGSAVGTQRVFSISDVKETVKIETTDKMIENGCFDAVRAGVNTAGKDKFLISGGIVNTFYECSAYLGFQNLFPMLYDEPELVHYLSERILESNIERIRAFAKIGGDAIYIDDATATCDMISLKQYEEFSLPYLTRAVTEIQRLGKIAVLIYFGGIQDRISQIASTGAKVLQMEASMKNFTNDYDYIAERLDGKMCLMGNLNPYEDLEITNDEELHERIRKQVESGRKYGKYISCTGSPITPYTSVERIKRYIDMAHML